MTSLDIIRQRAQTVTVMIMGGLWVSLMVAATFTAPERLVPAGLVGGVVLAIAAASWRLNPNTSASRSTVGAALVAFPALFVYLLSGKEWQIDMHMMFFAALSISAVMLDWRVIVAASAATAVHHLSLNFFLPWALFPEGAEFFRVVFHAVVVVGQAAALGWMTYNASEALIAADRKATEADAAQAAAAESAQAQAVTKEAAEQQRTAVAKLARGFAEALRVVSGGISGAAEQVSTLASDLSGDAQATREGATQAANRASTTNSNVQSVAAAAQELSASIGEVARILENSGDVSDRAAAEAEGAGRSIDALETAAKEIEDIMRLVADVAEQTNLLALNATIEAARAGEAGKGFAVVASEVKALAEQTTRASSDIGQKIEAMRGASGGAATSLGRIAEIISELRTSTESVQGAFAEQNQATQEIASLAERAAVETTEVNNSMGSVSDAAQRTNEAAEAFTRASSELGEAASRLDQELNHFRAELDAA